MIVVEQLGQQPFLWTQFVSDGPCPKIDRPCRIILDNYDIVVSYVGPYSMDLRVISLCPVKIFIVEVMAINTLFEILNFAVSEDETHPNMAEFEKFFERYSLPNFIET